MDERNLPAREYFERQRRRAERKRNKYHDVKPSQQKGTSGQRRAARQAKTAILFHNDEPIAEIKIASLEEIHQVTDDN